MHIAVIGAGVAGVATAAELAGLGATIEVFERGGSVAEQASHANPVLFGAGWAPPGSRGLLPGDLALPLPANWTWRPGLWRWLQHARQARNDGRQEAREAALRALLALSRERLAELERQWAIAPAATPGLLVLLRGEAELKAARPGLRRLAEAGVAFDLLDAESAREAEPALAEQLRLRAAIRLPHDGVGNSRLWAQQLRTRAQQHGVRFHFGVEVTRVVCGERPQLDWRQGAQAATRADAERTSAQAPLARTKARPQTQTQTQSFDAVVLCSGNRSLALVPGLRLPLTAVPGPAVTAPLREHDGGAEVGPRSAIVDARSGITIARIGDRVRAAAPGRLGDAPATSGPAHATAVQPLYRALDEWFPGAALTRQAQTWCGARIVLPDGLPVIGPSGRAGVWINAGHGGSGWALACGAAVAMATAITGRTPPVDLTLMSPARWR
jgi:D-amino-acid dehydrogenase